MSYTDTLHKVKIETPDGVVEVVGASYNGVSFFVDEASVAGGRKIVTTALPFTNDFVNEDLGGNVPEFTLSFYLIGENVEAKRKEFEAALNEEGPFQLVHPYYGNFVARCRSYSFKYSKSALEFVSGEVSFVPEKKSSGGNDEDLRGETISKSKGALESSRQNFDKSFNLLGKAKGVVDAVSDFTNEMLNDIDVARGSVRSVSQFVNEISGIRENMQLIVMTPGDFSARIQNLLTMTSETFGPSDAEGYVNESLVLMQNSTSKKSAYIAADDANDEIERLKVMSSAAMSVRYLVECEFVSSDDAAEMQDKVSSAFESVLDGTDDADDYSTLVDLEATALKYLRDQMSKLASIVECPVNGVRNALSVCFDCYGSLDKLDDVMERNSVRDPMFVHGPLKVLSK